MSTLVYSVSIDAGRIDLGDVPAIGFISGQYRWSSASRTGFKTGIIDQERISSFGMQCNITYGGEVASPTSAATVSALSQELLDHIQQNGVRLVGKSIIIQQCVDAGQHVTILSGIIADLQYKSNNELQLSTSTSNQMGSESIVSTVTNRSILLGIGGDSEGESTLSQFGDVLTLPMKQYTNGASPMVGTSNKDGYAVDVGGVNVPVGISDLETFINPPLSTANHYSYQGDGRVKVRYEMFVSDVYNDSKKVSKPTRIRVCYANSTGYVTANNDWIGGTIKIIRGAGAGEHFGIVGIEDSVTDSGTNDTFPGPWLVLDKRADNITPAGTLSNTESDNSDPYWGQARTPSVVYDGPGQTLLNPLVKATYVASLDSASDTSVVVLGYPANIYMVPSNLDSVEITGVFGYTSGATKVLIDIPTNSVKTIISDETYSLIQVVPTDGLTRESDTDIDVSVSANYRSYLDNSVPGDLASCTRLFFKDQSDSSWSPGTASSVADQTQLSASNWTNVLNYTFAHAHMHMITLYTRIDGDSPVKDVNASSDFVSSVYPIIALKTVFTQNAFITNFVITIRTHVISEFGVSIGYKEIDHAFKSSEVNEIVGLSELVLDMRAGSNDLMRPLVDKIKNGLDVGDICRGVSGNSAKYLYTTIVVEVDSNIPNRSVLSTYVKAQGVGLGVKVSKSSLCAKATKSSGSYSIETPANLIRSVLNAQSSVFLDNASFNAVEEEIKSDVISSGGNHSSYAPSSGATAEDIVSNIAHWSNIGVIIKRNGDVGVKWWINDYRNAKSPVFEFTHSVIETGSLGITRPGSGYMCTDYSFTFNGSPDTKMISVNTSGGSAYPNKNVWSYIPGVPEILGTFSDPVDHPGGQSTLTFTPVTPFTVNTLPFVKGMYYLIKAQTTVDLHTICLLEGIFCESGVWKLLVRRISLLDGSSSPGFVDTALLSNTRIMRQQEDWKYLVSSNLSFDYYLLGKNAWEIAKRARDFTGLTIPLSNENSKISQPMWTTEQAIANHTLYSIAHCSYPKTLIRMSVPAAYATSFELLDYVKVSAGPYLNAPTYGWVVSWELNPADGIVEVKVLTAVSDEDTLYLDENHTLGLNAQMVIDETVTGSIIDEGVI